MRYQPPERPLRLNGFAAARQLFAGCMAGLDPSLETIWVAHIDEQARCLHLSRHDGHGTGARFPLREIIRDAAVHGSAGIVLAHNHPSGDSTPSTQDIRLTRNLVEAGKHMKIAVHDHVIVGSQGRTSLRALGLI